MSHSKSVLARDFVIEETKILIRGKSFWRENAHYWLIYKFKTVRETLILWKVFLVFLKIRKFRKHRFLIKRFICHMIYRSKCNLGGP